MSKRKTFNLFIIILLISLGCLYYLMRPEKIREYNYSHETVSANNGKISSLSTSNSDIIISPRDIIVGSLFISVICYYLFYYGSIIYLKSR